MSSRDCVACSGAWPPIHLKLADLGVTRAYLNGDQFFPGWTFLVLRRHATELFELSGQERAALIEDVSRAARALATVFDAAKMNYELLGNQLGHIHWHVIPRRRDDPAPREPVWRLSHEPRSLASADLAARLSAIRAALAAP